MALDQPGMDESTFSLETAPDIHRVSRVEAEAAVRTLLIWARDDPDREGLRDTPARVAKAYAEFSAAMKWIRRNISIGPLKKFRATTISCFRETSPSNRTASITSCQ